MAIGSLRLPDTPISYLQIVMSIRSPCSMQYYTVFAIYLEVKLFVFLCLYLWGYHCEGRQYLTQICHCSQSRWGERCGERTGRGDEVQGNVAGKG